MLFRSLNGEGDKGRFYLGENLSYGDLAIAAILVSVKLSLDDEAENELKDCGGGRWKKLLDHCDQHIHK